MTNETNYESFFSGILEILPDAVIWGKPVRDPDNKIIDFEIGYSNKEAETLIAHPKGSLLGLHLLRDGVPDRDSGAANFQHFLEVYEKGDQQEWKFHLSKTRTTVEVVRRKFNDGVLSMARDRKAQREAEKKEQEQTRQLKTIVQNAPAGIVVYEAIRNAEGRIVDFKAKVANQQIHLLTGFSEEDRMKFGLKQLLTGTSAEQNFERYIHTVETGEPFSLVILFDKTQKWLSFNGVKLDDGFLTIVTDVTEKKQHEEAIQHQSDYLNSILNTSRYAINTLKAVRNEQGEIRDLRYVQVNKGFVQVTGLPEQEVIGKTQLSLFPHTWETGIFEAYRHTIETGEQQRIEVYYKGQGLDAWYDHSISKLDDDTAVGTFSDITQSKLAAIEAERQKTLLNNILKYSSSGISVTEVIRDEQGNIIDGKTIIANDAAEQFTQLPKEKYLTETIGTYDPNILKSPIFHQVVATLETGTPFHTQYFFEPSGRWLELSVSKMDQDRVINVFTDITVTKKVQLELEQAAERLQAVFNAAQSGMYTLTPVHDGHGEIKDFRFVITNPTFAAYVGQTPEVLNGALCSTWFPGYLQNGLLDMFQHTYLTGESQRRDVHYHVDGHDVYLDLVSTRVADEVLVTFNDYTQLKKTQLHLEKLVEELKRSNSNLEEFAYAASHDLKEPIRKIHVFSDRLKSSLAPRMSETETRMFERMEHATERMHLLVEDLLEYSHVSKRPHQMEDIDLNKKLQQVLSDLEVLIEEKKAFITAGPLPLVKGYRRQLQQLFQNLISNALKYHKPGVAPEIHIASQVVAGHDIPVNLSTEERNSQFYLITVQDLGIGFEQQYAERIFNMFQRLHGKAEYSGTGIGLSIVRKVVENHNGYIWAESEPGHGATFSVLLPVLNDQ